MLNLPERLDNGFPAGAASDVYDQDGRNSCVTWFKQQPQSPYHESGMRCREQKGAGRVGSAERFLLSWRCLSDPNQDQGKQQKSKEHECVWTCKRKAPQSRLIRQKKNFHGAHSQDLWLLRGTWELEKVQEEELPSCKMLWHNTNMAVRCCCGRRGG